MRPTFLFAQGSITPQVRAESSSRCIHKCITQKGLRFLRCLYVLSTTTSQERLATSRPRISKVCGSFTCRSPIPFTHLAFAFVGQRRLICVMVASRLEPPVCVRRRKCGTHLQPRLVWTYLLLRFTILHALQHCHILVSWPLQITQSGCKTCHGVLPGEHIEIAAVNASPHHWA